ncbi:uncharacterized protein LOC107035591 [Diachasma alloeum]|uniref:uncharacterized protein LOC107035591 n=1 Tax=Diachasma alloeum TaxID=454923 RepID=UPI0007382A1F|nr:uncharacterized protein LOC107035591 [Diachasma alloeum]
MHNHTKMWKRICALFGVLCVLRPGACTAHCYSQFCHNTSLSTIESQGRNTAGDGECLLTAIQNNSECMNMKFHGLGRLPPPGVPLVDLKISAYVYHERGTKATAFNLTVRDITFRRLVTRYQERGDSTSSYCRHIHFHGSNDSDVKPSLFVSCPFATTTFEERSYWFEYLIIGDNYEYSRKLLFNVPSHHHIGERVDDVRNYIPFAYIDVSDIPAVSLHIQPIPKKFNTSDYRIWVINNDTGASEVTNLKLLNSEGHIRHNFTMLDGAHYVYVTAMHPDCDEQGCINSTLPVITVKQPTRRILIMIISVVWIPPVILYAIYYLYKLSKKKDLFKQIGRRPKCLLVYSPTHMAHVDVVSNLAKYLRSCNVAAMVDVLDIPETDTKDPGHWCNEAFKSAETVVVLASPSLGAASVPVIYRNVDNHALRLLKENYSHRNKRYIAVELPYCTSDEIPEEARLFKKLRLPESLDKLVKYLHNIEFVRCFTGSSQALIESINLATIEVSRERQESPKNIDETHELLPIIHNPTVTSVEEEVSREDLRSEDSSYEVANEEPVIRTFRTQIDELNLLGEVEEPGEMRYEPPPDVGEFRIDQLDL